MKWRGRRKSRNVEDRRSQNSTRTTTGLSSLPTGLAGGGFGGIILLVVIFLLMNNGFSTPMPPTNESLSEQRHQELFEFVSVVLADTEDVWNQLFQEMGYTYREPTLVIYEDSVSSACGYQSSAVGPFYCPADQQVYIDLSFYNQLETQFGASGDFAMAYVVAHEVGHHVQTILGVNDEMTKIRNTVSQTEYNRYSVAFELQADYLAGVWAHHVADQGLLEDGDIDEALRAASAIGDDTIQKRSQGYVVPDSFTHGTSEQRKFWFYHGFETGDLSNWNTFEEIIGS